MLSDSLLNDFQQFLISQKFTYQDEVETKLKELCDLSEKCKYSESIRKEIDRLKNDLTADKENNLIRYKDEILSTLKPEIVSRYRGEKGRIEETLKNDNQVIAAIGLLLNDGEYKHRLNVR